MSKKKIEVKGVSVSVVKKDGFDFICITDIARSFSKRPNDTIKNYLRNSSNISFLAEWENIHNPSFKAVNMNRFKMESTSNAFILSVSEWVKGTGAIGIYSVSGRYGGTYAHKDIAYQFCMWLNPSFYLYVVKEFDRLKQEEQKTDNFYLNKMFDDSLQINRMTRKMLEDRGEI